MDGHRYFDDERDDLIPIEDDAFSYVCEVTRVRESSTPEQCNRIHFSNLFVAVNTSHGTSTCSVAIPWWHLTDPYTEGVHFRFIA